MPETEIETRPGIHLRRTVVVEGRYARRWHQTQAAVNGDHGLLVISMEELAARLAGGFLRSVRTESLKASVADAVAAGSLAELDNIKNLPGFQRAAAATLSKAWRADLGLAGSRKPRTRSLAILEREIRSRLPKNQLPHPDLAERALNRAAVAPVLFGRIEIHGRAELSPVWRDLLLRLSMETEVVWVAGARPTPGWLKGSGIDVHETAAADPEIRAVSCATPRHEILEALRWARQHLTNGTPAQHIAITAASPATWDDHVLAMVEAAKLPVHFIHGKPALATADGQLAAALAEVLLRGLSRSRMVRLVGLLRSSAGRFHSLPEDWREVLPDDAPLLNADRWEELLDKLSPEAFSDGRDHRPLLRHIIEVLRLGLARAEDVGAALLTDSEALAIWKRALVEGPPAALDVTLAGLRVQDEEEPGAAIVWGPASSVAAVPRPFCRLVGLTSRSWPRRAGEDPLIPTHVVRQEELEPLPVHESDRRDFETICRMADRQVVCSRARRDSEGRLNGVSPLYPEDREVVFLAQGRVPGHAASESDRLAARRREFAALPLARSAIRTWRDWRSGELTAHDGLISKGHPMLLRALDRTQSATSLSRLLRDPLGYLWTYGFGWKAPEETEEPLTLDALAFGSLLHEFLGESVNRLEGSRQCGIAGASHKEIERTVTSAANAVADRWTAERPVPPPVIWRRKCEEARELAVSALTRDEAPLPGQRTWAEVQFGYPGRKRASGGSATLPWDLSTPVYIDGTRIRIGGFIDRLDLSEDRRRARVTDYKSGKFPGKPPRINGGAELQRCLYAFAVRSLIPARPEVEARLVYPRSDKPALVLDDTGETLAELASYFNAATDLFVGGKTLSGAAAADRYYDLSFALPGRSKEMYLKTKGPLSAMTLMPLSQLWEQP
ncbi:MAG: PD-(D/E)XK nuclease family protein [Gemmatimonadota bacterium]|nr:PD-(D/E)XK nuclease family protein [Gemmatimonadota bacterium]